MTDDHDHRVWLHSQFGRSLERDNYWRSHEARDDVMHVQRLLDVEGLEDVSLGLTTPFAAQIPVTADWHPGAAIFTVNDDPMAYAQRQPDGPARVYPLGPCPRCSATVPLGKDPSESHEDFLLNLFAGVPVDHLCTGTQ